MLNQWLSALAPIFFALLMKVNCRRKVAAVLTPRHRQDQDYRQSAAVATTKMLLRTRLWPVHPRRLPHRSSTRPRLLVRLHSHRHRLRPTPRAPCIHRGTNRHHHHLQSLMQSSRWNLRFQCARARSMPRHRHPLFLPRALRRRLPPPERRTSPTSRTLTSSPDDLETLKKSKQAALAVESSGYAAALPGSLCCAG